MKGIKNIKNYRLIREIGRGATGVVYESVDDNSNKLFAIKAIPSQKLKDTRALCTFKREIKLLHHLKHDNIIKIYGIEKTVNNVYLVLEYCNGGSLYNYLTYYMNKYNKPIPEEYIQKFVRQIANGLQFMHENKIIHRDIKSDNICLNFDSVPNEVSPGGIPSKVDYDDMTLDNITLKIVDLGYARELDKGVATTICGTAFTMAPDIFLNINNANKENLLYNDKVDLWSLGALTYELLVGSHPFNANNFLDHARILEQGNYTFPKNLKVSVEMISFINSLLQFYPEKRANWAEIINHDFLCKDIKDFHYISLEAVSSNESKIVLNTKDYNNFLWANYKVQNDEKIEIDKLDHTVYISMLPKNKKKDGTNSNSNSKENKIDEEEEEVIQIDENDIGNNYINANNEKVEEEESEKLKEDEEDNVRERSGNVLEVIKEVVEEVKESSKLSLNLNQELLQKRTKETIYETFDEEIKEKKESKTNCIDDKIKQNGETVENKTESMNKSKEIQFKSIESNDKDLQNLINNTANIVIQDKYVENLNRISSNNQDKTKQANIEQDKTKIKTNNTKTISLSGDIEPDSKSFFKKLMDDTSFLHVSRLMPNFNYKPLNNNNNESENNQNNQKNLPDNLCSQNNINILDENNDDWEILSCDSIDVNKIINEYELVDSN